MVCGRCRYELSAPFFSIEEPDGSMLDVEETFAPRPIWLTLLIRIVLLGWAVFNYCYDLLETEAKNRWTFVIYLTRWAATLAVLYLFLSFLLTINRSALSQPDAKSPTSVSLLVKLTWAMYNAAFPISIAVFFLFWTLDYEGEEITYKMLTHHLISMLLIGIDGAYVALVPVRLKHFLLITMVAVAYSIWTVIHYYLGIGDGDWEGESPEDDEINDDLLYTVIDWGNEPTTSAFWTLFIVCVLDPICFFISWILSAWDFPCGFRRRIFNEPNTRPQQYAIDVDYESHGRDATPAWAHT